MLSVFKKIWFFSGRERNNLTKSIVVAFFHAIFNAFQFVAIYYMIKCLFKQNVVQQDIVIALVVLIISLMGKIITQNVSQMNQTHAGYFMAANKRIELGEKIKRVPMGFFNNFSLGKLTTLATTNLTQIESWIPVLLVNVLGGFLNTFVFFYFFKNIFFIFLFYLFFEKHISVAGFLKFSFIINASISSSNIFFFLSAKTLNLSKTVDNSASFNSYPNSTALFLKACLPECLPNTRLFLSNPIDSGVIIS